MRYNAKIRKMLNEKIGHNRWNLNDHFMYDLGLSIIEKYELIMTIDTAFNIKAREMHLAEINSPIDLINFIEGHRIPVVREPGWYAIAKKIYLKKLKLIKDGS